MTKNFIKMKRYLLIISLAFLTVMLINNCKSPCPPLSGDGFGRREKILPDSYEKNQVIFGKGGGFTGKWTYYYLLENGELYKNDGFEKEYEKLKNIDRKKVKEIFNRITEINFENIKFNHPSNMTYFIEFKNKDKAHRVSWGNVLNPPPIKIKELEQLLNLYKL
ncbi:unnamed protein product [marine sediment metagenome]|uniref:Uncharacterized protein n=1 Tax=marine sediment metagenome TaxID=412755 RepID=X1LL04_9ZZZZ